MAQGYGFKVHRAKMLANGMAVQFCNPRELAQTGTGKWAEVTCQRCLNKRARMLAERSK